MNSQRSPSTMPSARGILHDPDDDIVGAKTDWTLILQWFWHFRDSTVNSLIEMTASMAISGYLTIGKNLKNGTALIFNKSKLWTVIMNWYYVTVTIIFYNFD